MIPSKRKCYSNAGSMVRLPEINPVSKTGNNSPKSHLFQGSLISLSSLPKIPEPGVTTTIRSHGYTQPFEKRIRSSMPMVTSKCLSITAVKTHKITIAGKLTKKRSQTDPAYTPKQYPCIVCLDTRKITRLPCSHDICDLCLKKQLKSEITKFKRPACVSCNEFIPWSHIRNYSVSSHKFKGQLKIYLEKSKIKSKAAPYEHMKQQILKKDSGYGEKIKEKVRKGEIKPCATCGMLIEKDGGCKKVVCGGCHSTFCWVCDKSHTTGRCFY